MAVPQGPESHENGEFAWIMDPDGNKIEIWAPKVWDHAFVVVQPPLHTN